MQLLETLLSFDPCKEALNHTLRGCLLNTDAALLICKKQSLTQQFWMLEMLSDSFLFNLESSCSLLHRPPHGW